MKILIWVGSLRSGSFSRKLAEAVVATALESPDTFGALECGIVDGRDLPLYDQDLDGEEKPAAVHALLEQVSAADAQIFVTPEFNYGIPGTLKNAIDWASRPAYRSPLKNKPSVVISHSIAPTGGVRAHAQLCSVLAGTLTPLLNGPGFSISAVHEKFGEAGALEDEAIAARLKRTLEELHTWAATFGD